MANRIPGLILVALAGLVFSPVLFAQEQGGAPRPAPRLPNGKPDLSGVWTRARGSAGRHFSAADGGQRQGRVEVAETTAEALMLPEARESPHH